MTTDEERLTLHLDLDCFYVQVEANRLHLDWLKDPVAVQQWQGLIAIGYAARSQGVTRHMRVKDAMQACPQLKLVHVAVYARGRTDFAYLPVNQITQQTHKVSLAPYRRASRKIMQVCERMFPNSVEKASVDEVFIDFTAALAQPETFESVDFAGVRVLNEQLDQNDALTRRYARACQLAIQLHQAIKNELNFSVSVGVSRNKLLSKLCSSHNKPDCVSVLVPYTDADTRRFMRDIKVNKVRGMGGQIGTHLVDTCKIETVGQLLELSEQEVGARCKGALSDKQVAYLLACRAGECHEPINPRISSKSFMSAKSLVRNGLVAAKEIHEWLVVLCAELVQRCQDEYASSNKWPKSMHLLVTHGSQSQSYITPGNDDVADDEGGDDEQRVRGTGGQDYSRMLTMPHPSDASKRMLKMLSEQYFRDFPQPHRIIWVGVKVSNFVALQRTNIQSYFKTSDVDSTPRHGSKSAAVTETPLHQLTSQGTPNIDVDTPTNYIDMTQRAAPDSDHFGLDVGDVAVDPFGLGDDAQSDANSDKVLIMTDTSGEASDKSTVHEFVEMRFCEDCRETLPVIDERSWQEHQDYHAAKKISVTSQREQQGGMTLQQIHNQKVAEYAKKRSAQSTTPRNNQKSRKF